MCGLGLAAPSLALRGIFRELDLVGTGKGGAIMGSFPKTFDLLGLLPRCPCSTMPFETRAFRRISGCLTLLDTFR